MATCEVDRPTVSSASLSPKTSPFPVYVSVLATVAALNNVAFGYDVGVISGSLTDMAASLSLNTLDQEMATSGLNFVSGFGALVISGALLDRLGRRKTLLLASILLIIGGLTVALADSLAVLMLGRALQGLGSGASWCACSVYITEIAPSAWRGALVAISDISINAGILLGYGIDRAINVSVASADVRWRVAMGLSTALPLLYVAAYAALPETPRWLAMVGRLGEARSVLQQLNPAWSDADTNAAMTAMTASALSEASQRGDERSGDAHVAMRSPSWRSSLWPASSRDRSRVLLALALGLTQQLTGTEAILYYTPRILNQCTPAPVNATLHAAAEVTVPTGEAAYSAAEPLPGDEACVSAETVFLASIGVGACKFVGELIAAAFVDRMGRRSVMASTNLIVSLFVFLIALKFSLDWPTAAGAACLCLVMLFFSLGPGPLTFVVINEMLPLTLRAKVVALAVFFNRLGSGTIALTFLSLKEAIGVFAAFSLYAGLGLLITAFYATCVPDMTGRSLEGGDDGPEDADGSRDLLPGAIVRSEEVGPVV